MSTQLRTRMILDLEGGYENTIKAWDKATQKFFTGTHYSLGVAQRAWGVFGAKIDGIGNNFWTRVAGAGGLAMAARQVGTFDESMTRIGINANASAGQVEQLKQKIFDIANRPDIKVRIDDLAAGVAGIVERTGDLKYATDNIENLGHVMQATGEDADSIGELMGTLHSFGVKSPQDVLKVVDAWTEMGKQSGLSLQEMVKDGGQVLNVYQGLGRTGPQALKEVGAVMNMLAQSTGRPRTAMAQVAMMLEQFQNPQARPFLNMLGVEDLEGHLKMPLDQAMKRIVEQSKGSNYMLSRMFGMTTGGQVFAPLMNEYQAGKPLDALNKYLDVTADGTTVVNDSARAAKEAAEGVNTLTNAWERFENKQLSKPLKEIGDALDKMDPVKVEQGLKVAEYTAGTMLAIYGGRKLIGAGRDIWSVGKYILGGGKKGGAMGALDAVAGVQRVFVVNMPGGGSSWGGGEPNWTSATGGAGKVGIRALLGSDITEIATMGASAIAGSAALLAAAGAAGFAAGHYLVAKPAEGSNWFDKVGQALVWAGDRATYDQMQKLRAGGKFRSTITGHRDASGRWIADGDGTITHQSNINLKLSFDRYGMPVVKGAQSDSKLNLRTIMYGGSALVQP